MINSLNDNGNFSLVELARTLDLEVMLVPRQSVPAVQSIVRSSTSSSAGSREAGRASRELSRLAKAVADNRSALPLEPGEVARLQRHLRELRRFRLSDSDRNAIRAADRQVRAYLHGTKEMGSVRQAFAHLEELRSALAHRAAHPAGPPEPVRPAYGLDEDENA
jgi:hypothetical protein